MTLTMASADQLGLSQARLQHLVTVFNDEVARKRLPGAVLLVGRNGHLALKSSVGWLNAASGVAMHDEARFRIYSMTKPVVSVAAMILVERGQLLLSDPVARYLPEFANQQVAREVNGEIVLQPVGRGATVHDLLRHTAGLTYEFLGGGPVHRQYSKLRLAARDRSLQDFSQALATVPLLFEPGTVFEYSRATDVLGRVVEVVSGKSLQAFLQSEIFAPLNMANTGFTLPARFHADIAEPFARDPDGGMQMKVIDVREDAVMASGSGGLISTADDYAQFLQCLLNKGELGGVRLLGRETVEFMTTDHLGGMPVASEGSRQLLPLHHGFGLGFAVRQSHGGPPEPGSVGTYYWAGLAGTSFFVDPALDLYGCLMIQAPNQREHYRMLFRNLVYSAVLSR